MQHPENKNYRFILIVIDFFSKYYYYAPLYTKKAEEVSKKFNEILKMMPYTNRIKSVVMDQGGEFSKIKLTLARKNINVVHPYSQEHSVMVERLIRTLKEHLGLSLSLCYEKNRKCKILFL